MDAIEFVVRGVDGSIRRGSFEDINGQAAINVGDGDDVSINIRRYQAVAYTRDGEVLVIEMADGRTLRLNGFFEGNNDLFLSADGVLTEVTLSEHTGGIDAVYQDAQVYAKWSPDDALFFTGGPETDAIIAAGNGVDEPATMLAAPILAGLGGLGGAAPLAAAAALGGAGLIAATSDDGGAGISFGSDEGDGTPASDDVEDDGTADAEVDTTAPDVAVTAGIVEVGHLFNDQDHSDGVELSGTSEPGAVIVVTIGDTVEEAVTDENGNWSVSFDPDDVGGGEYISDVNVTATDPSGNSTTIIEEIQVDTVTTVTLAEIDGAAADSGATINAVGHADGVTMSGTGEVGASITIEVEGGPTATTVVDSNGDWSTDFPAGDIATGEYSSDVTITAIDAAGNTATKSGTMIVDTVTTVAITGNSAGSDGVVNEVENQSATQIDGTSQANSTVVVTLTHADGSVLGTQSVVSDASGDWQVSFPAGTFPSGEYDITVDAVATDAHGNSQAASATLPVDTITGVALTEIDGDAVNTGAVINAAERAGGVTMIGTGEPNGAITVTVPGGGAATTTVDANGDWTVTFAPGHIPEGEISVPVTVSIVGDAGNTATTTQIMEIDTVAQIVVNDGGKDDGAVINISEAADGVVLTGTTEANATVSVNFAGSTQSVLADGSGNWAAAFGSSSIPLGVETTLPITATFTDTAGNSASATGSVGVDTIVRNLGVNGATGDDVIDAAEAATGFTLTGTTEAGAQSVSVAFGSAVAQAATVDAAGNWYVTFGPDDIPHGEYDTTITVTTVDKNDNTDSVTSAVQVDTAQPDAPVVISYTEYTRGDPGVSGIGTELNDDITGISKISETGTVSDVSYTTNTLSEIPGVRDGEMQFTFNERIPNGSHLVVNAEDGVGNENATLVVLDEDGTDVVNATSNGLDQFDIGAIDLSIAEDSVLTLTEADLLAMSGVSDTLIVHGDANDVVHAAGLVATGATEVIGDQAYDVYSLGSGSLIIDSDIAVNPVI